YTYTISIDFTNMTASGALGSVRNSADATQYIGCWSYNDGWAGCRAGDSNGNGFSCYSTDPATVALIRSLTNDSYLSLNVDRNSGLCSFVMVWTDSALERKN